MSAVNVSRRGLLRGMGALIVGTHLPGCRATLPTPPLSAHGPARHPDATPLNAFVRIAEDDTIAIALPQSEMGQGVFTALPMLVAEELDADWARVQPEHGAAHKAYAQTLGPGVRMQVTGGSTSVPAWHQPLREAGATARAMLVAAAAARWDVSPAECTTENSVVTHAASGKSARYGELVSEAARMSPPAGVQLKDPADYRIIGTDLPRADLVAKVDGTAAFGMDTRLAGMKYATVVACPVFGGRVGSVDEAAARAVPGVLDVLAFDDFVAVVADSTWHAKKGAEALSVTWDEGPNADLSSAAISAALRDALDDDGARKMRKDGKARKLLAEAETIIEADYEVPYVHHATMEPMNCTAHVQTDRCDVWAPTQAQTLAVNTASKRSGLSKDKVFVHTTFLGGGFGRRGQDDFVDQAVQIATRTDGPVQLVWTREEGFRHGFYRPAFTCRQRATLTADGRRPHAWHARASGDNVLRLWVPGLLEDLKFLDTFAVEGLPESPYAIEHVLVEYARREFKVPIGFWRSVGHSHNAFFKEGFFDEIAHAAGRDPVELRRELLEHHPRERAVLDKAAEAAGWGSPPAGRHQGVALHESFGSIVAEVAEISVTDGQLKVHKVTAAVDCGPVVHPDTVHAQVMGAIGFGLSEALRGRIEIDKGRVVQSNFHDYPLLSMAEMPEVEVHIIEDSGGPVGGIGEVGTPPIAPAVCNAIFAATGQRIRSLPILDALRA